MHYLALVSGNFFYAYFHWLNHLIFVLVRYALIWLLLWSTLLLVVLFMVLFWLFCCGGCCLISFVVVMLLLWFWCCLHCCSHCYFVALPSKVVCCCVDSDIICLIIIYLREAIEQIVCRLYTKARRLEKILQVTEDTTYLLDTYMQVHSWRALYNILCYQGFIFPITNVTLADGISKSNKVLMTHVTIQLKPITTTIPMRYTTEP